MTRTEPILSFGEIVRFHRRKARLTQAELARLSGVGKTVVFDIENGKPTVRLDTLLKVLEVLNIRIEWRSPLRASYEEWRTCAASKNSRSR